LIKKTGRQNGSTVKVAHLFAEVLGWKAFIHAHRVNICNLHTA
jgi:hypothetical protein